MINKKIRCKQTKICHSVAVSEAFLPNSSNSKYMNSIPVMGFEHEVLAECYNFDTVDFKLL